MIFLLLLIVGASIGLSVSNSFYSHATFKTKLINMVLGAYGALATGFFMNLLVSAGVSGVSFVSLIVGTIGASTFVWARKKLIS